MSAVDEFVAITASNIRTATYCLSISNNDLNRAIDMFFTGSVNVPDSFRPDLIDQPLLIEETKVEVKKIEVPKPMPIVIDADSDIIKPIDMFEAPKENKIDPLPLTKVAKTLENNPKAEVYHLNPSLYVGLELVEHPMEKPTQCTDDSKFLHDKSTGTEIWIWKNGISLKDEFISMANDDIRHIISSNGTKGIPKKILEKNPKICIVNACDEMYSN